MWTPRRAESSPESTRLACRESRHAPPQRSGDGGQGGTTGGGRGSRASTEYRLTLPHKNTIDSSTRREECNRMVCASHSELCTAHCVRGEVHTTQCGQCAAVSRSQLFVMMRCTHGHMACTMHRSSLSAHALASSLVTTASLSARLLLLLVAAACRLKAAALLRVGFSHLGVWVEPFSISCDRISRPAPAEMPLLVEVLGSEGQSLPCRSLWR